MEKNYLQGLYFGIISGTITTTGLIIGLRSGTMSKLAIISGILAISISDTLSDAFGLYISKKAEDKKDISDGPLKTAIGVIFAKFIIANSFLIPVLLVSGIDLSVIICLVWSAILIVSSTSYLSIIRRENVILNTSKYLFLTFIIVIITHYSGDCINKMFSR
tara:strand:- start:831 stop:1316 length:486 start_codon:yes stop_codon:yes gene_type:complete